MKCNPNYIWTGDCYESEENAYVLYLGSGRTMCDIVNSNSTRVPEHLEVYAGDDTEVPASIRCTDRDLVVRCSDDTMIQTASVCYFDAVSRTWRGPYLPENSYTDSSKTWFVFRDYLDLVIPFKSELRLQLSGNLSPIKPGTNNTEQSAATTIQIIQPPEEFKLALEVFIYNDPEMDDLNTSLNSTAPLDEFPIRVFNGEGFVSFPVDGVSKNTAGQYVTVDLKNLTYTDTVYIKWIWRGIENQAVAGYGSGVYPAFTLTNPDNIGLIWETNM